ncbi:MAG: prepilin-type N-terminal cleavage/methylation domain-containing protein [Candidatus Omnitrophota bacterium]|jgi:Tfp pilus assembly protein PilV
MKEDKSPAENSGFSLVEILIAMLTLALIMGGLANLFFSTQRLTTHHRYRVVAAELGRFFLDPLQMDVRQDQWGSNCLSSGAGCPGNEVVDGITYTPTYNTSDPLGGNLLRKVRLRIQWQEPSV